MSTINWGNIKELQFQNIDKQLKVIYSSQKNDVHAVFIKGNNLSKSLWELYERGVKTITVTDESNNILFQFTNNIVIPSMSLEPGYMGETIKDWNKLTIRNKETILRILMGQISERNL